MDRRVFNSVQEPVFGVLKEVQESGLWYVKEDKKKVYQWEHKTRSPGRLQEV